MANKQPPITLYATPESKKRKPESDLTIPTFETVQSQLEESNRELKQLISDSQRNILSTLTNQFEISRVGNEKLLNVMKIDIESIKSSMQEGKIKTAEIAKKVDSISAVQEQANFRLNQLEQEKLRNIMEINGAQLIVTNEPLKSQISKILTSLKINHLTEDITRAHTIDAKGKKIIVVEFASYEIKMRIMNEKFAHDKGKVVSLYFSHALTKFNRALLFRARQVAKARGMKISVANGCIYIKEKNEKKGFWIKCEEDLTNIEKGRRTTTLIEINQEKID